MRAARAAAPSAEPLRLSIAPRAGVAKPPARARTFYKVVAVRADGMFCSIFDGQTIYPLHRITRVPSGVYACNTIEAVVAHGTRRLPRRSALLDSPRAILRLIGWLEDGSEPTPSITGKYRLDAVLPVAVLPWSSTPLHERIPPQMVAPQLQGRLFTSQPPGAATRFPDAMVTGGASWRSRGTHSFSEHMQALTAQLHEDILTMQHTLEGLRVCFCRPCLCRCTIILQGSVAGADRTLPRIAGHKSTRCCAYRLNARTRRIGGRLATACTAASIALRVRQCKRRG